MSNLTVPIYTCDRCGDVQEIRELHLLYPWGFIAASQHNGPLHIGGWSSGKVARLSDLCPKCVQSLQEWWDAPGKAKP